MKQLHYRSVLLIAILAIVMLPARVFAGLTLTIQIFDVPGSDRSHLTGINNVGQMSGMYLDSSGHHPFRVTGAGIEILDVGWSRGINDHGTVVGDNTPLGSNVLFPNAVAHGINNSNIVVGSYTIGGVVRGFRYDSGAYEDFFLAGSQITRIEDVNELDQLVGWADNGSGAYGFVDSNGIQTIYSINGRSDTYAADINNDGFVVGWGGGYGWVHDGNSFTEFQVLGFTTEARGINDLGQIVGMFQDGSREYGFIATIDGYGGPSNVPEPISSCLVATTTLVGFLRIRKRKQGS